MKKILFAFLLVLIASSCKENKEIDKDLAETKNNSTVFISGNVQLQDSLQLEDITIYGYDIFHKKGIEETTAVDENGDFKTTLNIQIPTSLTFYGNNSFKVLAAPGDSIQINYIESKEESFFKSNLKFSGPTALTQEKLQEYLNNNPLKIESFYEKDNSQDYSDLQLMISSNKSTFKKYYESYLNDDALDQNLKNYIAADQKFAIINAKMDYASYAKYYGKLIPKMDGAYYNDLNSLQELTEDDLVNTDAVNNLLYNINTYAYQLIEKESPQATEEEINQELIDARLASKSYLNQQILSMMIMNDLDNHSIKLYENNSDRIMDYLKDSSLLTSIQRKYLKTKDLIEKPELPTETELLSFKSDDPSKFIDEIISNANGKVIYIDNWATWCGPCKSEFKEASPQLHEKFKRDVEFVYLCHASKEKAYIPSIAEYKIKGKHYFLTEAQGSVVQKQIQLEGFPTYTIIDKNGKQILSDYIHRPSYKATTEILTQLVNGETVEMENNKKTL